MAEVGRGQVLVIEDSALAFGVVRQPEAVQADYFVQRVGGQDPRRPRLLLAKALIPELSRDHEAEFFVVFHGFLLSFLAPLVAGA
jgi:hypothetical protein